MAYTLGQAAKATGKGKSTILKAIKNGRISATKNDIGDWEIDPAELHRVYLPASENGSPEQQGVRQETGENTLELIELRVKLEASEQRLRDSHEQVVDLRQRLDQSEEERRRTQTQLTALLTDQRQKEEPPPPKGFWRRLLVG
jgi:ATPase subunit of ABC transporter with duplicated ATPase domains